MTKNESEAIADVREALLEVTNMRHDYEPACFRDAIEIRYALIDPILWSLGWHTWLPEECRPDLSLGDRGRIHYGLIDYDGELDIMTDISTRWAQRRIDRVRLTRTVAGITIGVAVLTDVFGSERLTGALLDRLTHHVHIVEMNGDSYRLKGSRQNAVSLPPEEPADA